MNVGDGICMAEPLVNLINVLKPLTRARCYSDGVVSPPLSRTCNIIIYISIRYVIHALIRICIRAFIMNCLHLLLCFYGCFFMIVG